MKNINERGSGNRLAAGKQLLQEGNDPADHAHVLRSSPISLKRKELENDQRYATEAAPDTNKVREGRTTRLRRAKDVRPL